MSTSLLIIVVFAAIVLMMVVQTNLSKLKSPAWGGYHPHGSIYCRNLCPFLCQSGIKNWKRFDFSNSVYLEFRGMV